MSVDYLVSVIKIILFDLVLSGDNAVVIGLAAHMLPPEQRRKAMFWGCGMAIAMRIAMTLVVAQLLLFPGLKFVGAVLLAWIACKLIQEEAESKDRSVAAPGSLFRAVWRIAMADFIMSLDNVVAIAGASQSDPVRIVAGLILSITMLLLLSAVITEIMSRYRWIAYVGAAILAWTAGEMMAEDLRHIGQEAWWGLGKPFVFPEWAAWALRVGVTILCVTVNRWLPGRRAEPADAPPGTNPPPLDAVHDLETTAKT
jgi:YjbE family integral membrane protein